MKKNTQLILVFLLPLLMWFSQGCFQTNNNDDDDTDWQEEMNGLNIPNSFNYETFRAINIEVKLPFTVDYSEYRGTVNILTAPESLGGVLLFTGAANSDGVLQISMNVPSYLEEVYVYTSLGSGTLNLLTGVFEKGVNVDVIDIGSGIDTMPPRDTAEVFFLKDGNRVQAFGVPSSGRSMIIPNLVQNGGFDENNFGLIQEWSSPMQVDGKWHVTYAHRNSVSRYNYEGDYVCKLNRSYGDGISGGVAQLINASRGDRITFSADVRIQGSINNNNRLWLFLIPRNASGASISYYSVEIFPMNTITGWRNYTVAATMPVGTTTCQVLFWAWDYGGAILYDNAFVTGPVSDSDGDGVDDEDDDYPDDPLRAYNIYYPARNTFGSLAYEDNWPGRGDYDFNDFVVDYHYHQVTNAYNQLVDLFGRFVVRAIGASYTNGFGVMLGMQPSQVGNVSGISLVDGYITLLANNTEAGQEKATIIITDNAFTQLPHPGGGIGVNTTPGQTYVEPDTMEISVFLEEPVALATVGYPPYNPFIIVDQVRGREVHLPDYQPTSLANPAYFGTEHDDSNPSAGRYYKTMNNLPWGINLTTEFDYPVEKAVIIQAYLRFADWAESSGSLYSDWYLNLDGYRNNAYIFQVPE